ncbi:MAG: hypothetical protein JO325_06075 [Solirubrobacterales bacterium]|nr:hypothetical protein [Solirubrobacterales bacterium]
MCGFAGALSRSMFPGRVIDSCGLLVPLGMLLGESGRLLKHRSRLAQTRCEAFRGLLHLIWRLFGGDQWGLSREGRGRFRLGSLRGSGTAIRGGDLALDRGLLPVKPRLLTLHALVGPFLWFSLAF